MIGPSRPTQRPGYSWFKKNERSELGDLHFETTCFANHLWIRLLIILASYFVKSLNNCCLLSFLVTQMAQSLFHLICPSRG